ncbi:hypothetical protein NKH52_25105 [Mesorhizobium sp. M1066]|uniref:hypothetical protein n=1 Tax=unclassified Mesorhizobium TaxID=325217 RepID=UPI003338AD00
MIALESDQPGVSVSQVARKDGIGTGMRSAGVQFGVTQKKRAQVALVALTEGNPPTLLQRDLVQPPDGMTAIDLLDDRRRFAPADSDPDAISAPALRYVQSKPASNFDANFIGSYVKKHANILVVNKNSLKKGPPPSEPINKVAGNLRT